MHNRWNAVDLQDAIYPFSPESLLLAVGLDTPGTEYPRFHRLADRKLTASSEVLARINLHVLTAAFEYTTSGLSLN